MNEKEPKNIMSFSSSEPSGPDKKKTYDSLFRHNISAEEKDRLLRVKSKRPVIHRFEQEATDNLGYSDSDFEGESEDNLLNEKDSNELSSDSLDDDFAMVSVQRSYFHEDDFGTNNVTFTDLDSVNPTIEARFRKPIRNVKK